MEKANMSSGVAGFIPNPKLRLLDQVSEAMRFKHYSIRTERTCREWIKRFIFFHGKRHPREMGAEEVGRFLSDLALTRKVAASTPGSSRRSDCAIRAGERRLLGSQPELIDGAFYHALGDLAATGLSGSPARWA